MPLYDLRCPGCGEIRYNEYQPATTIQPRCDCGQQVERVWTKGPPVHIFQAGFYENAAGEDGKTPYFDDRKKYKNYLKEHGMYADYVEGR